MLISMNWIGDFVDLSGINVTTLIKRFTLSTAEVEDIFEMGRDVRGVVVGQICTVEKHPESDHLHLLTVDTGCGTVNCVCGAPNVRQGMKVAFAAEGGRAGGMDITRARIAGYESCGMCCSERELGISADHSGIMELDADAPVGADIKTLLDIDDVVFEVDNKSLTNRPDLWGHYGIAREFAALSGRPLKSVPQFDAASVAALPAVDISIDDPGHGYRYVSAAVSNITRKTSPVNMRIRLFYCGLRAINLLTDLTNYVMLELGQPMHAFDRNRVGSVRVRRFDEPFDFVTLDGETRRIDPDTLMICQGDTPVAVAGVMGGLDSEITDDTDSLLLESACFDGISIRKTSTRLGLRTDASMRYEKMLAPELCETAALRYLDLLCALDPGVKVDTSLSDVWVYSFPEVSIHFDKAYVDRYTGIDISSERIETTLDALGFAVTRDGDAFSVEVPSWRRTKDVTIKADIIEEITRIYGYDNFEIHPSDALLRPARESEGRRLSWGIKTLLADKYALNEVHSYIWCDSRRFREIGLEVEDNVKIINSLSTDWTILRKSMIPTLLTVVNENRQYAAQFGIFEQGRVADGVGPDGTCNERRRLGIVLFDKTVSETELFGRALGLVASVCRVCKESDAAFERCQSPAAWQHPANTAFVLLGGERIGNVAVVHPSVTGHIDKKASVVAVELDMDILAEIPDGDSTFAEPSRFPGVEYDLTLLMDANRPYGDVEKIVAAHPSEILTGIKPVDVYADPALPGKKSLSVRLSFGATDRTLAGGEVQQYIDALINALADAGIGLKK